jgi:hypothetical protein
MVWLSHYEEYPIYEPAEGGYYYSGLALVKTERLSKRAAKRKFDEMAKQLIEESKNEPYPWCESSYFGRQLVRGSKYIGEGAFICIERKKGIHESGWKPYS